MGLDSKQEKHWMWLARYFSPVLWRKDHAAERGRKSIILHSFSLDTLPNRAHQLNSLTPLLNNARPVFLKLLPTNPHLMKRAQTRQNAPADPTTKPSLRQIPRRVHFHP